jgi:hypothetical protein
MSPNRLSNLTIVVVEDHDDGYENTAGPPPDRGRTEQEAKAALASAPHQEEKGRGP